MSYDKLDMPIDFGEDLKQPTPEEIAKEEERNKRRYIGKMGLIDYQINGFWIEEIGAINAILLYHICKECEENDTFIMEWTPEKVAKFLGCDEAQAEKHLFELGMKDFLRKDIATHTWFFELEVENIDKVL